MRIWLALRIHSVLPGGFPPDWHPWFSRGWGLRGALSIPTGLAALPAGKRSHLGTDPWCWRRPRRRRTAPRCVALLGQERSSTPESQNHRPRCGHRQVTWAGCREAVGPLWNPDCTDGIVIGQAGGGPIQIHAIGWPTLPLNDEAIAVGAPIDKSVGATILGNLLRRQPEGRSEKRKRGALTLVRIGAQQHG